MTKKVDHEKRNAEDKASKDREISPVISGVPEVETFKGELKENEIAKQNKTGPNKNEVVKCSCCNKYLKAKSLKKHINRCHKNRTCPTCGIVINNLKEYERHCKKCENRK